MGKRSAKSKEPPPVPAPKPGKKESNNGQYLPTGQRLMSIDKGGGRQVYNDRRQIQEMYDHHMGANNMQDGLDHYNDGSSNSWGRPYDSSANNSLRRNYGSQDQLRSSMNVTPSPSYGESNMYPDSPGDRQFSATATLAGPLLINPRPRSNVNLHKDAQNTQNQSPPEQSNPGDALSPQAMVIPEDITTAESGSESTAQKLATTGSEIATDYEPPPAKRRCASCCKSTMSFLVSTVGLTCLMIGYTVMGGFIFMKLESPNERILKSNVQQSRKWHVEMLWNLTYELNILYPENWTKIADEIMENYTREVYVATKNKGWDGKEGESEVQWTFAGALLYSITVVTTIGYGHIAPRTTWGRFVTIIYALFGIPLTLLTITNLGGFMATTFRFIYKNICCGLCCICCVCCRSRPQADINSATVKYRDPQNGEAGASRSLTGSPDAGGASSGGVEDQQPQPPKKYPLRVVWRKGLRRMFRTEDNKRVSVPITVSVLVMSSYIIAGAVLFTLWEPDWDYVIGAYFCFITLTTIGFGDFVPGTSEDSWANQEKLVLCAFYLLFGLALIAMCFDLMQEEARNMVRAFGVKLGIISKEKKPSPSAEERPGY